MFTTNGKDKIAQWHKNRSDYPVSVEQEINPGRSIVNRFLPVIVFVGLLFHIALNVLVILRLEYRFSYYSLLDLCGIVAGLYVTDLISNFIHWLGDCNIPWQNRFLIRFHELSMQHHRRPADILKLGFFDIRGNIAFFYSPQLILAYLLASLGGICTPMVFFLVVNSNLMLLAHSIHKACHKKNAGAPLAVLQSMRLIIPSAYHLAHHAPPFNRNFSAINGWSDPLFEKLVAYWNERH